MPLTTIPHGSIHQYNARRTIPTSMPTPLLLSSKTENFGTNRDKIWYQRSKRWIVLVDDEESIRKAVGQYLFDQGYQVTACADAETALKVCLSSQEKVPDVIISDIFMPVDASSKKKDKKNIEDGLELLQKIRLDKRLVSVPVVLLTAKGTTQDRINGYKAGADAYLPKPFDSEELISIVDNAIARHEALNGENIKMDDLKQDLSEIKDYLLTKGGGGVGNGWVKATNVFLTPMEREILQLLCKGMMNKEIAKETFLSQRRVEQLLTTMFRKTGLTNRTELVRWAVSAGIVKI